MKVGDTVASVSLGGQEMVVGSMNADSSQIQCWWFDEGCLCIGLFAAVDLVEV